jgi:hypothetical protein
MIAITMLAMPSGLHRACLPRGECTMPGLPVFPGAVLQFILAAPLSAADGAKDGATVFIEKIPGKILWYGRSRQKSGNRPNSASSCSDPPGALRGPLRGASF